MDASARAAWRRKHWTGGIAGSHEELEQLDLEWAQSLTSEERLESVYEMWDEQASLQEGHEAASRLQRAVGGVRTRRR